MTLNIGEILQNRYRIDALLAQGGMGAVYLAHDLKQDEVRAVKEMAPPPGLSPDEQLQHNQQFWQEAAVLAKLDHPSLPRVHGYFQWRNGGILVMDYVGGLSLEETIEQLGALPEEQVLDWADQLLDALEHCHDRGVLHRDIKPANIIIRPDGRAMLVDFGLVKLWNPADPRTMTMVRGMGTPAYAPPEQYGLAQGHTEARSDIYSIGATLYHALTGEEPPSAGQRMADPRSFAPPRTLQPDLSLKTEAAVLKAMEIEKSRRFPSAKEMALALAATPSAARRNPMTWVLAAVAAAILVVGAAYLLTQLPVTGPETPTAPWPYPTVPTATVEPPPPPTLTPTLPPTPTLIVPGSAPIQLTSGDAQEYVPSYSPDGRHVAYMSNRDGTWQIYVMNSDGSEPRRLTTNNADNYHPRFSPDGREIAYASKADGDWDIYVMDLNGRVLRQLTDEPGDQYFPRWSPDGGSIVYMGKIGDNWEVFFIDAGGGSPFNVTNHPAGDVYAVFSPDGRHLIYQSSRDGNWEIYRMELSSGAVRRLTNDSARDADPSVSPDGQWIAFESERSGNYDLWVIDWNGGNLRQLTRGPANDWLPAFAPDGSGVIFQSDRTGEMDIYAVPFRP